MTDDLTRIRKRSISIAGHATSVSLEDGFWEELTRIAALENCSVASIVRDLDDTRTGNLSSAIRVFVLERLRTSGSTPEATD